MKQFTKTGIMTPKKLYFSFQELTVTDTGLPNLPYSMEHVMNLSTLSIVLSNARELFGAPICVNSAFRTPDVNARVKGSKNSFHLQGLAADIRPNFYPAYEYQSELERLAKCLKDLNYKFKEFIVYPTFIHVAV